MSMTTDSDDRLARAKAQAQRAYEDMLEQYAAYKEAEDYDEDDDDVDEDGDPIGLKDPDGNPETPDERMERIRETILEEPLSLQIRSDWYSPGEEPEPAEFELLLSTGGPALRIIGDLDGYNEPSSARLQVQDWFIPWTDWFPKRDEASDAILWYARMFNYG